MGEYGRTRQEKPDQKNGVAPGNKGAGAEQDASQEETSKSTTIVPIKQQQHTGMTSMTQYYVTTELSSHHSLLSTSMSSPTFLFPNVSFAQVTTPFANRSSSASVFPLCKHTLTLSLPLGTVGHVIGRTFMPRARRYADSGRGCGVSMGIIGEDKFGCEVTT